MPRRKHHSVSKTKILAWMLAAAVVPSYGQNSNEGQHLKRRHLGSKKEANNVFQRKGESKKGVSSYQEGDISDKQHGSSPSVISKGRSSSKKLKTAHDKAVEQRQRTKDHLSASNDTAGPISLRSGLDLLSFITDVGAGGTMCKLNGSGLYGDIVAAQVGGGKSYVVDFNYYTSIATGISPFQLNQEILPEMDRAVALAVLPHFFPCVSSFAKDIPESARKLQQSRAIDALSSLPMDLFVIANSCAESLPDTDCYMARGAVTVVAKDVFHIEALKNLVRVGVRTAFQSGAVMQKVATDHVKGASFLEDAAGGVVPVPQTASPIASPPVHSPTVGPSMLSASTRAPTMPAPPPTTVVPTTGVTVEPTNAMINLTSTPTGGRNEPTLAPQSPDNTTDTTPSPVPQDATDEKKRPLWWVWLLVGLGGVLLFVFLLTLCEEVDKSSGNQKTNKRSDDTDERFGSAYIPPTEAAKAAAAHLRKHQNNYSSPPPSAAMGAHAGTFIMDSDSSEEEYKEEAEMEEELFNDEGTYASSMVEIVEEEVESVLEEAEEDLMITYVEEEVSDAAGTFTNRNETSSYGSEY